MSKAFISVGSNIEPEQNIASALSKIKLLSDILAVSTFYKTTAIGNNNIPDFYNGMISIKTDIEEHGLKFVIMRGIEDSLGRKRTENKYSSRTIDLDVIIYDDKIIDEPDYKLPDPDLFNRPFLAYPLAELEPNLILPGTAISAIELASKLDKSGLFPLVDFTKKIKSLIKIN